MAFTLGTTVEIRLYNNGVLRLFALTPVEDLLWVATLGCSSAKNDLSLTNYREITSPNSTFKLRLFNYNFQLIKAGIGSVWTNRNGIEQNLGWWETNPDILPGAQYTVVMTSPNLKFQLQLYNNDLIVRNVLTSAIVWYASKTLNTTNNTQCADIYTLESSN